MDHMELVEKLREKTGVTYEEARAALENHNWDLLDAVVELEHQGKIKDSRTASYSTKNEETKATAEEGKDKDKITFGDLFRRFFSWVGKWVQKGNQNFLRIESKGQTIMNLSVTVFVVLLVFCFWAVIPILILGLFCGCHYSFHGPHLGRDDVNQAMEKASGFAEDLKHDFQNGFSDQK